MIWWIIWGIGVIVMGVIAFRYFNGWPSATWKEVTLAIVVCLLWPLALFVLGIAELWQRFGKSYEEEEDFDDILNGEEDGQE